MESLSETTWDVVLSNTGFSQSLLALALSRSGKKVLHLDENNNYGGAEAALSLEEAKTWADAFANNSIASPFRQAAIQQPQQDGSTPSSLGFSRAYSLSLSPQLIYTRSNLLPALVSSKVYRQLEFLAIGSWWMFDSQDTGHDQCEESPGNLVRKCRLRKIPGGREDVFADTSIDLRSSRSLMRFLRLAADAEAHTSMFEEWGTKPFAEYLSSQYNIPEDLQTPLFALTMSPNRQSETTTAYALPRIHRHLTSIGLFGPGFGAVIPKWGGLAEIAQVACRAGAVGGGVYVLGKGIKEPEKTHSQLVKGQTGDESKTTTFQLNDGEMIQAALLVSSQRDTASDNRQQAGNSELTYRSISIVSSSLSRLFSAQVEGAPPSAGSVVVFPPGTISIESGSPPVDHSPIYLMIHSSDTGECPAEQCVLYAQTSPYSATSVDNFCLLALAIAKLLQHLNEDATPQVLWRMQYAQEMPRSSPSTPSPSSSSNDKIITIPDIPPGFILEDDVLRDVRTVWERIVGEEKGDGFMNFADREDVDEGEEGDV